MLYQLALHNEPQERLPSSWRICVLTGRWPLKCTRVERDELASIQRLPESSDHHTGQDSVRRDSGHRRIALRTSLAYSRPATRLITQDFLAGALRC